MSKSIKTDEGWECKKCGKILKSAQSANAHQRVHAGNAGFRRKDGSGWNKGLTSETDERVKRAGETLSRRIREGKVVQNRHTWSEQSRKRLSDSMKIAHAEGRAHNIGECRHKCEPSWPETFFSKVIENEFEDKDYVTELTITRPPEGDWSHRVFAFDFAWVHKKKAIEIDGEQHSKSEYKKRDAIKDSTAKDQGWTVLRIKWKDMFSDTKKWINIAKSFIDDLK